MSAFLCFSQPSLIPYHIYRTYRATFAFLFITAVFVDFFSPFLIIHASGCHYLSLICSNLKASGSYAEQNCIPDIGAQVVGWFPDQEQWCRAQVTKICGLSGGGFRFVC